MNFLSKKKGAHNVPLLELETVAILFSLPYALLMWRWVIFFFHLLCYRTPVLFFSHPHISMVTFVVAFLHLCFENSNIITLSSIGSLTGIIAALGVWCIWRFWEKHPVSDVQPSEKLFSFEKNDDSERRSKKFTFEVVVPESLEEPQSSVMDFKFPLSFDWPSFRRQSNNVEEP